MVDRKKYSNPLFILVNNNTGSAAEALAFSMQQQKRAQIIGKRSAGAAHMNSWYVINDCLFVSISTGAPTIPGTEISWERIGIIPDFEVDEGKEIEFIRSNFK
ncbi:S41 family peptidase [Niabella ginsengisoli]|uniref:S41 family peptidase n=1 Tax=Niabella ginsengisoli TaxID=522298 RepID=UPI00293E6FA6|nr:S41 family peptidase [Niabella ginsengisoli]